MRFKPRVTAHFHASAALYKLWSPEGHLHFGYWKWPLNPFRRGPMLDALIDFVVDRLKVSAGARVADLGCGYGASARYVAKTRGVRVEAYTVVEEQVEEGTRLSQVDGTAGLVTMHMADFRETGLPPATLDGVYALESLCYGADPGKRDVLHEIARLLKPGARLALVDGFLTKTPDGLRARWVDVVAQGWALPGFPQLPAFITALEGEGFQHIEVSRLNWRIGPSGLHGIALLVKTLATLFVKRRSLAPLEKAHLRSCVLGILLGAQFDLFAYCLVTAER